MTTMLATNERQSIMHSSDHSKGSTRQKKTSSPFGRSEMKYFYRELFLINEDNKGLRANKNH